MHFLEILKFGNSRRIWVLDHAKNDRLFLSVARVFGHEKCRTHLQAAVECVDALGLNLRLNKTNVWKFLENVSFSINNKLSIHFLEMCRLNLFLGCSTPVHTVSFGSNQMGHETKPESRLKLKLLKDITVSAKKFQEFQQKSLL